MAKSAKKSLSPKVARIKIPKAGIKSKAASPSKTKASVSVKPKTQKISKVIPVRSEMGGVVSSSKLSQKWSALFKKSSDVETLDYSIVGKYEPKTALLHKTLGWGYVLSNRNDRLEVLFQDGIKYLISNYKRD